MDYRDLRQGIITSMLIASLLGVAGVSPVTANQEAEAKQDILDFVQSRNQQHYMQTLNAHVKELVTLFSQQSITSASEKQRPQHPGQAADQSGQQCRHSSGQAHG